MNFLKIIKNFPFKASKCEVKNLRRLYSNTISTELPNKGKSMPNEPILPRNWYKDKLYENYENNEFIKKFNINKFKTPNEPILPRDWYKKHAKKHSKKPLDLEQYFSSLSHHH